MRDRAPDPQASDIELVGGLAWCPEGACAPVFATPLLELASYRMRDLVRDRNTASAGQTAAVAPSSRQREDAPHD